MRRILLVEDSPRDAELAMEVMSEHRLLNEVHHVRDGVEAMEYLHRRGAFSERSPGNPAAILLDLKMPRMDGLELLRRVRSDPHLKLIPIVIMTSSREEQDVLSGYQLGTNAYVVKPVRFPEFVQAVRHVGGFWAVLNEPPKDAITFLPPA